MKKLLLTLAALFMFTGQAKAQSFTSFDDVADLLSSDVLLYYCSTCTPDGNGSKMRNWTPSIGGLPDVDTTGLATDDLLRYDGTNFLPLNIDEIVEGSGGNSIRLGLNAVASAINSVAVGKDSSAGTNAIALGESAAASGIQSTALGQSADASGQTSTAVGRNARALGQNTTVIGSGASSLSATNTTVVGASSQANNTIGGSAFGRFSRGHGDYSVALGHSAHANFDDCVAVGSNSNCTATNQIMMGTETETVHIPGELEFASAGGFRLTPTTVAGLGAAEAGRIKVVTDATDATDCTTGGGSTYNVCLANGTSWIDF